MVRLPCHDSRRGEAWHGLRHICGFRSWSGCRRAYNARGPTALGDRCRHNGQAPTILKPALLARLGRAWRCWVVGREPGLKVPDGLGPVHLPRDSPQLQPGESLWPVLDQPIANKYLETIEPLDAVVAEPPSPPEIPRLSPGSFARGSNTKER